MLTNRRTLLSLAAVALLGASVAHADAPGDAWAAAKGSLPASPMVVVGVNFNTIRGSQIFQQLFPAFLAQAGDAQQKLEEFKADCGLDPLAALQGVVVVQDTGGSGAAFMSTKGVDRSKVESCLTKLAAKDKKQINIGKPDAQGIVTYSGEGSDTLAFAYLPKGVIAASDTPEHLKLFLAGHGVTGGSPTAKALGAVNTGAAIWFVVNKQEDISGTTAKMKAAYGHADVAGGTISADIRIVTENAKQAAEFAKFANGQVEEAKKQGQIPPQATNVMKTLKIAPSGDEVQFKAQMAEQEALSLVGGVLGGGAGAAGAPAPAPAPGPTK